MRPLNAGLAAAALLLGACDGPPPEDIAGELRALRVALSERQGAAPGAGFDGKALAAALEPLQQAVKALLQEQNSQQQRQLALTEEMGRFASAFAAASSQETRQTFTALQARLQELETTLKAQDQRHREVEAMVQKALDGTVERLDAFLQRLGQIRGEGAVPATPESGSGQPPGAAPETNAPKAPAQPNATGGNGGEPRRQVSTIAPAGRNWLPVVLVGGLLALSVLAWRWSRPVLLQRRAAAAAADRGMEEMWAAAIMLGDAPPGAAAAPAAAGRVLPGDDVLQLLDAPASSPALLAPPTARTPALAPERSSFEVRVGDRATARSRLTDWLAHDPRVLRRPAPLLSDLRGALRIECTLLPGLQPGEREHLRTVLQRLALGV